MFSSEMTLASAWIHLLVVDLFAARYTFVFLFCKYLCFCFVIICVYALFCARQSSNCHCNSLRQVFHDGQENQIETRHSVSLCLLFCPIGIMAHFITKALTGSGTGSSSRHGMH